MAKTFIEKMEDAGVAIQAYKRKPAFINKDTFVLNNNRREKKLYIWPGIADIEVATSKRHKQAVLNVTEKARKVTQNYRIGGDYFGDNTHVKDVAPKVTLRLQQRAEDSFPIVFPDEATVTYKVDSILDVTGDWDRTEQFDVTVTASVSETQQAFLVGTDETELFVSMLPKQVKSVADAHEVLKPKGLREGWLRQGEFFFNPPTDAVREKLDKHLAAHPDVLDEVTALQKDDGSGWNDDSSHYANTLEYEGKTYAIGFVTDREFTGWGTRAKARHHEPLWLNDWYEVLLNRELPAPESATNWD
jgi:hypothetical protein